MLKFRILFLFSIFLVIGLSCNSFAIQLRTENHITTNSEEIIIENQVIENQVLEFYQNTTVIIRNNQLINSSISLIEGQTVEISNNQFQNSNDAVITIFRNDEINITGNTFEDMEQVVISVFDSETPVVMDNTIRMRNDDSNSFALYVGMTIERSAGATIANNYIQSPVGDGLYLFNSPNSVIHNNYVHESGFSGIAVSNSANTTVTNNRIIDSSQYSLRSSADDIPASSALSVVNSPDTIIRSNRIQYSDNTGIDLTEADRSLIADNTILLHQTGIFVGLSVDVVLRNNTIIDADIPIEFDQSPGLVTSANTVSYDQRTPSNTDRLTMNFSAILLWIVVVKVVAVRIQPSRIR